MPSVLLGAKMANEAILLIGHGSKLDYNKQVLELQAENLRRRGHENVFIGYNEKTMPLVGEKLAEIMEQGFDTVYAMPVFIASGVHITRDIPRKLGIPEGSDGGEVEVDGRKATVKYGEPLGNDPRIADILTERIESLR